jgi:DNA repair protein RadC
MGLAQTVHESFSLNNARLLSRISGVGQAKACRIVAGIELGRRLKDQEQEKVERISTSADVVRLVSGRFEGISQELFIAISVDIKNRPISIDEVARGAAESVSFFPRDVFSKAVTLGASGIVCVHNHPSGDPSPSPEDHRLTDRLREGAKLLGIRFLDHVIVANGSHYSFANHR